MSKVFAVALMSGAIVAAPLLNASPARAGDGGAIAAGVVGGLAAGAIIGSAMAPRPYYGPTYYAPEYVPAPVYAAPPPPPPGCFAQQQVWSERYQAYVMRNVPVPCY